MRLLHTSTISLSEFYDDEIPKYAILSHTWGKEEVSLHDLRLQKKARLNRLEGYRKIKGCCARAALEGYQFIWIDTCCIDKTSSAELSEAINSMYRWYQDAQICYAYLADVCIGDQGLGSPRGKKELCQSRWFTRGWTLQELLAPHNLVFYDENWRYLGTKWELKKQISLVTGIQVDHMYNIDRASVAQKMSWASIRRTTRVEDVAYSLMGIFDVNMPLLYGEGKKAFKRLQHEIVKISDDESIFAWTDPDLPVSGIFAPSPKAFAKSGDVISISSLHLQYIRRAPYVVTNRGLVIEIFASEKNGAVFVSDLGLSFLPLNCIRQLELDATSVPQLVAIDLLIGPEDIFIRTSPGKLSRPMWPINVACARLVHVCTSHPRDRTNWYKHQLRNINNVEYGSISPQKLAWSRPYIQH